MSSVLAIVSRALFDKTVPKGIALGSVVDTSRYVSNNVTFDGLARGGALFLVTVRPPDEKLWLVGVLENPTKKGDAWSAAGQRSPTHRHHERDQVTHVRVWERHQGEEGHARHVAANAASFDRR